MRYGELFAFEGIQIILRMCVLCKDEAGVRILRGGFHTLRYIGQDHLGFFRTEGSVDKVVLHVDDDKCCFHVHHPFEEIMYILTSVMTVSRGSMDASRGSLG